MRQLIFLSNDLMLEANQKKYGLPMTFISYGYINGFMLKKGKKYNAYKKDVLSKVKNNDRIYGVLAVLETSEVFIRILDGIMGCSKHSLGGNHVMDLNHRYKVQATPIHFDSIDDFLAMKYRSGESVQCYAYYCNPEHKSNKMPKNRIRCDFDMDSLIDKILIDEMES